MKIIILLLCFLSLSEGNIFAQNRDAGDNNEQANKIHNTSIFGAGESSKHEPTEPSDNQNLSGSKSETLSHKGRRQQMRKGNLRIGKSKGPYELYASVFKCFGWYRGNGKNLTKQQAENLSVYYRLSGKDAHGHFTRMEALDGTGNPTSNHGVITYLASNLADHITQWLLEGNSCGDLFQESGYDAKGNLVYTYHPFRLSDGNILGHYTDQYGEPLRLQDGTESNDKYIHVKLDSLGREKLVFFVGDNLHVLKNKEKYYGIHYFYGARNELIKKEYLDYLGNVDSTVLCNRSVDTTSITGSNYLVEGSDSLVANLVDAPKDSSINVFSPLKQNDTTKVEQPINDDAGYCLDLLGHRARTHRADFFCYHARRGYTYRGDLAYLIGSNEYGEPSYVMSSEYTGSKIFCKSVFGGEGIYYDENNVEIDADEMKSFRAGLGKAYFVEVLTKQAYDAGLRSGDLIVRYAGFYYPTVESAFWKYSDELQAQIYMSRNTVKDIFVMRYDSLEKTHLIQKVHLPKGTAGEIGFQFIMGYLTKKEVERYEATIQQYLDRNNLVKIIDGNDYSFQPGYKKLSIIRPYKINIDNMDTWQDGLREDAIIIAVQVVNREGKTTKTYKSSTDGCVLKDLEYEEGEDSLFIYYTTDGITLQSARLRNAYFNTTYEFPKTEYENILRLEEQLPKSIFHD